MISFALQKTSHPLYHIKPPSLWHHIHLRHDITPTVSDIDQLYLCQHNLSTDITPTFSMVLHLLYVGHHTHYIRHVHCICVSTPTLSMISQPLYVWYLIQYNEIFCPLYLWHHMHYVWRQKPVCWNCNSGPFFPWVMQCNCCHWPQNSLHC